jgi:hypothetical protein
VTECSYLIIGRVLPERALLDISEVAFRTFGAADVSDGELRVQVIKSQITARFTTLGSVDNLLTLRNMVENAARSLLDIVGYCHGFGYDVDIVQAVNPSTSETRVFGIDVPALAGLVSEAGIGFEDVLELTSNAGGGEYLKRVLTDLREATKSPEETGFHCYRAVESLMNCCASRHNPVLNGRAAWELFRATYSVGKDEIMAIKDHADNVRHGAASQPIADAERTAALRGAWDIVTRYVRHEMKHNT